MYNNTGWAADDDTFNAFKGSEESDERLRKSNETFKKRQNKLYPPKKKSWLDRNNGEMRDIDIEFWGANDFGSQ